VRGCRSVIIRTVDDVFRGAVPAESQVDSHVYAGIDLWRRGKHGANGAAGRIESGR
jgi:hypothetical protein